MSSRSRSILDQIVRLKNALEGFSFDELSISEAKALKKSFESFRLNLEDSVWGNPLEHLKSELNAIEGIGSHRDIGKTHSLNHEFRNSAVKSIQEFIERISPLVADSTESAHLNSISRYIKNLAINEKEKSIPQNFDRGNPVKFPDGQSFNPRQIIEQVRFLSNMLITSDEIKIEFGIDPNLPTLLCGNPAQFYELLMKLVGSRISSLNFGTISIAIYPEIQENNLSIHVKLGEDVSAYNLNSIDRENRHSTDDLLELSRLVEKYEGKFWIGSDTPTCSTIHIQIPADISALAISQIDIDKPLVGKEILLLNPEARRADQLIPELTQWGASVTTDSSLFNVLQRLRKESYDLVMVYHELNGIDAFQACMRIRNSEMEFAPSIPVIAICNSITTDDLNKSVRVGINAVIFKSDSPENWLKTLLDLKAKTSNPIDDFEIFKAPCPKFNVLENVFKGQQSNQKELNEQIWKYRSDLISALGALKVHLTLMDYPKINASIDKMMPILTNLQAHHWLIVMREFQNLNRAETGIRRMRQLYSEMLEEYRIWDYELELYLQKIRNGYDE